MSSDENEGLPCPLSRIGVNPSTLFRKAEAEKDDARDRPGCELKEAESEEAEAEVEEGKGKDPTRASPCSPRDESGSEGSKGSLVVEEASKNPSKLYERS